MFEDEFEDELTDTEVPEGSKKASGRNSRKTPAMTNLQVGHFVAVRIAAAQKATRRQIGTQI